MMRFKVLMFLLLITPIVQAQENYSYLSDRSFTGPDDLLGYYFRPNHMEVPNEYDQEISPDEYAFGITPSNLFVNGDADIKGVYNINNINSVEFGFKLILMNPRNPAEQGHLKIILTPDKYVEALVFKRSQKSPEIIFFIPERPKNLEKKENAYFTNRWECELEDQDSLWGATVHPILVTHTDGYQQRFQVRDSTTISFREEITIIEKEIKPKKKKKKKKKEEEEIAITNIELEVSEAEAIDEEKEIGESAEELEDQPEKKIKIIKKYYLDLSFYSNTKEGVRELRSSTYQIRKVTEREDEQATPNQDRYQLEIDLEKGDPIYMYLTAKKTISYLDIHGEIFLMQGH